MSKAESLRRRTEDFAEAADRFCRALPDSIEGRRVRVQLGDAATAVAANYRATCRARSRAEFIAKLGVVLEEADESAFWLGFAVRTELAPELTASPLRREAEELVAIFAASLKTARRNR